MQTKGLTWPVPTGRRDGRVSLASDTSNLPGFTDSVDVQKQKFAAFGLNAQDLVTLVGKKKKLTKQAHQLQTMHVLIIVCNFLSQEDTP